MSIEEESICRICADNGQYNIFEDELVFDEKNLYGPDEFSDAICAECCDNLCNSYQFMLKVRDSENKLRTVGPPPKKLKTEIILQPKVDQTPATEENVCGDLIAEDCSEEEFEVPDIKFVSKSEILEAEKSSPSKRNSKQNLSLEVKDSIIISNYTFVYKEENGRTIANILIDKKSIPNEGNRDYFLYKWLDECEEASVYSCMYCVKGFGNPDFLIKHIITCHFCLACFKVCGSNKELNSHTRMHTEKLACPFCGKFSSYSSFRNHLRKHHMMNLPYYTGILAQNYVNENLD